MRGADPWNLWGNAREGSAVAMVEAPVMEPSENKQAGEISIEKVSRTFCGRRGTVHALDGVSLR